MAGIITNVGEDIKSLRQLRQEIENVKKALGSIDINVKIDVRKELEQKLQALTKQYDTLVSKAAEADAKLMESAKRIDKAVDTITTAQEKAAKAKPTDTTTIKEHASAVEGQAKAYLDLKDEIDGILGTREQNIRQMMQEQNAIKLINAEISQINKFQQYGGGMTATQSQRLRQLNDDLITHKQALAEVRQELANNAKMDIAAVGSMNELSQSLSRMRIAYRALNEDERNSQFGKNLLASIQEADTKIKELDATIGNHQRNVGNYQGSFNGLNMSVQQIVRELPAAKMGINMFFMAISNNLPIMVDQIKYAKEANAAMKAAGQEPVPVWKQLVSSLFSWQSAMMVGITLLTIYGKDIANWVKDLFKANDAQEQARKEAEAFAKIVQKAHEEWRNSVAQTAAQQITEYKKMQREWNKLGSDLNTKKKYVDANKDAFHQLGFAVNGVSDAERVMTGNTDAVVASIMARAKASAYYAQIQEATERYIKQTEYNKNTIKGGGYYNAAHTGDVLLFADGKNVDEKMAKLGFSKNDYKLESAGGQSGIVKAVATASGAAKQTRINAGKSAKILAENQKKAKDQLDKQISSLQYGIEATLKENQGFLKKIGVSEYKDYEDRKEKQKQKNESAAKHVDYDKMNRERSEAERNLENAVAQSRIDAMQESYEKEKVQREHNHKKELEDIDKQKSDFLRRKIEDAKQIFYSDPKNKDKKFNYSSVALSSYEEGKFDEIRMNTIKKHANEEREVQRARIIALNDYLKKYGSMQEQRLAIVNEYEYKIAKAQTEGERLSLNAQKSKALVDFDINIKKENLNWEEIFGDLSNYTVDKLKKVKVKLREMLSFDNLDLEGYKSVVEQIEKVNEAITDAQDKQNPFFHFTTEHTKERRKLEMEVADALQLQADITNKMIAAQIELLKKKEKVKNILSSAGVSYEGEIKSADADNILDKVKQQYGTDSNVYKNAQEAIDNLAKSEIDLVDINKKRVKIDGFVLEKQEKLSKFLSDISKKLRGFIEAFEGINASLQEIPYLLDSLGVDENSDISQGVGYMATASNDAIGAVKDFENMNLVGAAAKAISAVGNLVNGGLSIFGGPESDKTLERDIKRLTSSNDALIKSIDSLSEEMKKGSTIDADSIYEEQNKRLAQTEKNTQEMMTRSANAHKRGFKGEHSSNYYVDKGLKGTDYWQQMSKLLGKNITQSGQFFSLSSKEMAKVAKELPEIYGRIKDLANDGYKDAAQFMDEYISLYKKAEDLETQLFEKLTSTSFDSIVGDFENALLDMESDVETFSDNFENYMRKAIVSALISNQYKPLIEKWYNAFSHYMGNDGKLDAAEIKKLKETGGEYVDKKTGKTVQFDGWNSINKNILDARNVIFGELGLNDSNSSQKATANGISSITYEQANNIVALTTAGNISRDQIKDILTSKLSSIDVSMRVLPSLVTESNYIADELRTIQANSYIELKGIHSDTSSMNKSILAMGRDISDIRDKIKKI